MRDPALWFAVRGARSAQLQCILRMTTPEISPQVVARDRLRAFQRSVLRWYDRHRRDLPWRKTRDPYRIWVSEIMLQQTRVAAVLDHYREFLKQFPNVRALAAATESSVLAAWSGLGYYRRARMMHLCAREIVRDHKSRFPKSSAELRSLPGIGRYTAAAIASIAFSEPVAVVDGNVERVLERIAGRELSSREMWNDAQRLLTQSRPADHNQAMMELGATVCTPRRPNCPACPVEKWCATYREQAVAREMERWASSPGENEPNSPASVVRRRQTKKELWCALVQRDGHIRLSQRPNNTSLMPGMWELPQLSRTRNGECWRTFRHSITTTDYRVHVVWGAVPKIPKAKWIAVSSVPAMPITGLTRKILRAAGII